jgi:predicted permease
MVWIERVWLRLQSLLDRKRSDRMLDDEIQFHIEQQIAENIAAGMSANEARYAAMRTFGNPTALKEETRGTWGWIWLEQFVQDLRYGARSLAKNPGFTIVAIFAVALGIGVNAGIFSVLNGVALKLLPVPSADQIVSIDQLFSGKVHRNVHGEPGLFSYSEYKYYRDNNGVFSGLLAYAPFISDIPLGGETPKPLNGAVTSCNFFDVLQEPLALGRPFVEMDCNAPGANPVAVVSDELWRTNFASDPEIVGKTISLNRTKFVVIGVTASGFRGLDPWPSQFWVPITMQKALEPDRDLLPEGNTGWLAILGRIRPGISLDEVRANLSIVAATVDHQYPERITKLVIHQATFLGRAEERAMTFGIGGIVLAAVGLVLLIACANVANLLLARASARQKEITIRRSIGGSRWRIVRQLLTESLLIAFLGGLLGSVLVFWSIGGIAHYLLSHLPREAPQLMLDVRPDLHVWGYALALTAITGIVFGLAPALHATRQDLSAALKGDCTSFLGRNAGAGKLRNTLVGVQAAVCMVLLIAAGLLMRGLYSTQTVDPGFEMKGIVQARFDLSSVPGSDALRAQTFQRELISRIKALPGVDGVEQARVAPLDDQFLGMEMTPSGQTDSRGIEFNEVSPGLFALLGMPIVRGRTFTDLETRTDARVSIVTESTARQLWPGRDAIGQTLRDEDKNENRIVGVVRDSQATHLGHSDGLFVYLPSGPKEQRTAQLLVRSANTATAIKSIREVARDLDPDLIVNVTKLEDNLELWRTPSRIVAALSGVLGVLALVLAAIGVHGVVSYGVSQRIREIGVRLALGADGSDVMSLVLRQAMHPVVIGGAIGIAIAAAVSKVLSGVLYGIGTHDPIAFIAVPLFLLAIAFLSSYIPAHRASRLDPTNALRHE